MSGCQVHRVLEAVPLENDLDRLQYSDKECTYDLGNDQFETDPDVATEKFIENQFPEIPQLDEKPHQLIALKNVAFQPENGWAGKLFDDLKTVLKDETNVLLILTDTFGFLLVSDRLKTIFHFNDCLKMDQQTPGRMFEYFIKKIPFPNSQNWKYSRILALEGNKWLKWLSKIIFGDKSPKKWWSRAIESKTPSNSMEQDLTTYRLILKFMLFTSFCEEKLCSPVPTYFFRTKEQNRLLHETDFKRLGLISKSGTGKSILLFSKMRMLLEMKENVLFVVLSENSNTLFSRSIKQEFQKFEKLSSYYVLPTISAPDMDLILLGLITRFPSHHIFMDEVDIGDNLKMFNILDEVSKHLPRELLFWFTSGVVASQLTDNQLEGFRIEQLTVQMRCSDNLQKIQKKIERASPTGAQTETEVSDHLQTDNLNDDQGRGVNEESGNATTSLLEGAYPNDGNEHSSNGASPTGAQTETEVSDHLQTDNMDDEQGRGDNEGSVDVTTSLLNGPVLNTPTNGNGHSSNGAPARRKEHEVISMDSSPNSDYPQTSSVNENRKTLYSFLKKHWKLICVVLAILILILVTVVPLSVSFGGKGVHQPDENEVSLENNYDKFETYNATEPGSTDSINYDKFETYNATEPGSTDSINYDKFETYDVTEPGSSDSTKIGLRLLNETSYEEFAQQCKDLGGDPYIPRNKKEEEVRLKLISSNRGGQSVWIHGPGCPSDTDCPNSDPENDNNLCMFLDDGTPPRRPSRTNCNENHLGICVKRNL